MTKRALVRCDGFITDIVEAGEEFEIYTGPGSSMKWVDIPDDATIDWKLELGEWIPDFEYHDPEMLRVVAYGDPGEQLSMLWKDIDAGLFGDAAKTGKFYEHIKTVRETQPTVKYEEVTVTDEMTGETRTELVKALPDEPFPHGEEIPAWMSVSDLDDDTQREFRLGKYAPEAQQPAPDA
jgi:hypothetical protein